MKKIKQIIATIGSFFQNLFDKEFAFLKKNSYIAVEVTNALKGIVQSPVADMITALIPGEADDLVKAKLRIVLPKVAAHVAMAHGILQASSKHNEMLAGIVEYVKTLNPNAQTLFWIEFSGHVNLALADGKVSFAEAITLAQYVFAEQKQNG